jgi:hypothetical protein
MSGRVAGLEPWLPWPLSRWRWWTEPVRAERLAALRIGVAICLLLDLAFSYFPSYRALYGADSVSPPELTRSLFEGGWRWSLLRGVGDPATVQAALVVWAAAAGLLLAGLFSRLAAAVCWALGVSVMHLNSEAYNAGDMVRGIILFYLMLCPCGAAWSLDAWWRRRYRWRLDRSPDGTLTGLSLLRRKEPLAEPVYIHPWPLCLLFVQMMVIYLYNGINKAGGDAWRDGTSLYYVLGDLTLARWSSAQVPLPLWLTKVLSLTVMWWELLFAPVMCVPWRRLGERAQKSRWRAIRLLSPLLRHSRTTFLLFGVGFHVGIWVSMEIGFFAPYMLCLYLPLVPWGEPGAGEPPGLSRRSSSTGGQPLLLGGAGPQVERLDGEDVVAPAGQEARQGDAQQARD